MTLPVRVQDLFHSETAFISTMQQLRFGLIEQLQIRGGELVLRPEPATIRHIKFGAPVVNGKTSDRKSELCPQIAEFFAYVREIDIGEIRTLEIRHGLPFSMEVGSAGSRVAAPDGGDLD
jgi:hypothetical protein